MKDPVGVAGDPTRHSRQKTLGVRTDVGRRGCDSGDGAVAVEWGPRQWRRDRDSGTPKTDDGRTERVLRHPRNPGHCRLSKTQGSVG